MFKVGDLVRINHPTSTVHGEITTIRKLNVKGYSHFDSWYTGHEVDIYLADAIHGPCYAVFEPHELIKIDDGERGSWDEIEKSTGWSPHKVLVQ